MRRGGATPRRSKQVSESEPERLARRASAERALTESIRDAIRDGDYRAAAEAMLVAADHAEETDATHRAWSRRADARRYLVTAWARQLIDPGIGWIDIQARSRGGRGELRTFTVLIPGGAAVIVRVDPKGRIDVLKDITMYRAPIAHQSIMRWRAEEAARRRSRARPPHRA